jgi:hypothetical protein
MGKGSITMDKSAKRAATQGGVHAECFQEENGMSTPIQPTQGSPALGSAQSAPSTRRTGAAFTLPPSSGAAMALDSFDTLPSSPPQEVLDEMAGAARVHDALHAQGRELHFAHDGQNGRMTIEVRDAGGKVLRTLSPAEALDVAAGKPLE